MGCAKKFKDFVKGFDLFSQRVGFRFDDQSQYETFTGGVCSIIMIIIFIAIFTGTTINTVDKLHVSSTVTLFQQTDPSHYQVGVDKFMFAIGMNGVNLNEGDRWFDISMQFRSYGPDGRNKTYMNLVPCEKSQWTKVNESFGDVYDRLHFSEWLCPENGTQLQLQGKYTSEYFKFYKFAVKECDPSLVPSRPCKNSSVIEDYLYWEESFNFNFYYVNTIINGGSHQYLNYYLEDMNYFPFSVTEGVNANLFMATYTITTDESIYPIEDIQNDTGGIVTNLAQIHNFGVMQDEYLKFYLRKSSQDILVERSFKKVDDTLSYIGGLFSAILAVLVLMSLFNQFSYELQIAKNIYFYDKNQPLDSDGFNFLVYLGYLIYNGFQKVGIDLPWDKMRKYHHSLQQVRKQMDVRFIMKKILYSERVSNVVLDEHQSKILHLQEPLTLEEAEMIRKDHTFYENLQKYYFIHDIKGNGQMKGVSIHPENQVQSSHNIELREQRVEQDDDEKKQCEALIEKMKMYVKILEEEVVNGDKVSSRILKKFDKRIENKFMKKKIQMDQNLIAHYSFDESEDKKNN